MISRTSLFGLALALAIGCERHEPRDQQATAAASANPVQHEMRVLHEATRDWVTAVANNDLAQIPASIPKIHEARDATEKALESGSYRPPKNSDRLEKFKKQDEAFHDSLVELLTAAKDKDLARTTEKLGTVLEGCTSCHLEYRF